MYNLEQLENEITKYNKHKNKIKRSKHAVVKLANNINYVDICVLSNIMVGLTGAGIRTAKDDRPFRIKKFKAHIQELVKDPNARIVLGGNLFFFPSGPAKYREEYSPSYLEQTQILVELLSPIKNKIIGAIDGSEEIKIFEKDGFLATQELMKELGLKERYFGQMAEIDFEFKNSYTKNTSKVVNMLFDHGFLSANVTSTVAKKSEGLRKKIIGKDFYFTSHYNKLFIEKIANLESVNSQMVKKPCYVVSVGGYRDYPNRLTSNRNVSPSNTDNGLIRVFVAPNPDKNNIRGNNYLAEAPLKICQEFINFGTTTSNHLDFDLCEEIMALNEENTLNKHYLIKALEQKIDLINKKNIEKALEKFYGEREAKEHKEAKKVVTKEAIEKVIIQEEDERIC